MQKAQDLNRSIEYYDERFGQTTTGNINSEEKKRLSQILEAINLIKRQLNNQSLKILDFGCGRGWLSNELSRFGDVTGIDLSPKSIENAKTLYPQVNFLCMNAADESCMIKLKRLEFDVIVSSEVIEHITDQNLYIENINTILKSNGFLILTTPNGRFKKQYFWGSRQDWGQPIELWLTSHELKNILKPHFLKINISFFNSDWMATLPSYGLVNLLGKKGLYRVFNKLNVGKPYIRLLEMLHFGLYQIAVCKK